MQHSPWKSVWIRGKLFGSCYVWQDWLDSVTEYSSALPDHITHYGAQSDSFKSGKYLSFARGRKQLLHAVSKKESFKSLSFVSVPSKFTTMIQDQLFGFGLSTKKYNEIQGVFHSPRFEECHLNTFEKLARQFFVSGRLEVFSVSADDLPMNYSMNFKEESTYLPRGFQSLKVEVFG